MSKSKNHTNHNQNRKAHRNGIKKVQKKKQLSTKGVCPKFIRNLRLVKKGNWKVVKAQRAAKAEAAKGESK